jgi:hypothetical protein
MNGTNESFLLNEVPLFARRRPKIVRSFVRSFVPRRRRRLFFSRALSLSLSLSLSARACVLERFSRLSLFFPLSPYNLSSYNTLNITLPPPPFPILTFFFYFFCLFLSLIESTRRRGVEKTHRSQSVRVL